jgi:hypothetical protein
VGIEQALLFGAVEKADDKRREIGVLVAATAAVGQTIEQCGELVHHFHVQRGDPPAELRAAQRGDPDLGEQNAALLVRGRLDEEEVERAREGALGVEDVELGLQRGAQVLDDLIDGGDQEVFLGDEIVMHQPGRHPGLGGDARDRGTGEPVLHDRGAQAVDDLSAPRLGETRPSHTLIG